MTDVPNPPVSQDMRDLIRAKLLEESTTMKAAETWLVAAPKTDNAPLWGRASQIHIELSGAA